MDSIREVAIITGASKGLGRAMAGLLARQGHALVINARRARELREVERELAAISGVVAVPGDVSEVAEEIAGRALQEFGRVDLLINNASTIGRSGRSLSLSPRMPR
jgi:NAD(P)-dependent dehydrogenase (short-subunit alcohol dehydrogenase family)